MLDTWDIGLDRRGIDNDLAVRLHGHFEAEVGQQLLADVVERRATDRTFALAKRHSLALGGYRGSPRQAVR